MLAFTLTGLYLTLYVKAVEWSLNIIPKVLILHLVKGEALNKFSKSFFWDVTPIKSNESWHSKIK